MNEVTYSDSIRIMLTQSEIKYIISNILSKKQISKVDNVRNRHKNIQFDCLLRGYCGEFAIIKYMLSNDILFDNINRKPYVDSIDIDFSYKNINIELKTSLVPDFDKTIDVAISKRDIKLLRRGQAPIENFLGDVHIQIYIDMLRSENDTWLSSIEIDLESNDVDYIYNSFNAKSYMNNIYFVGWIDKITLVSRLNQLPEDSRYWCLDNFKKCFWNCRIKESNKPADIIRYLQSI